MENLENVIENNIHNNQDSFYTEIASFSGSDAKEQYELNNVYIPSEVKESKCNSETNLYKMRIKLFKNENIIGYTWNELLLDGTCKCYDYVDNTAYVNGRWFNPNLHLDGALTSVYSTSRDSLVELSLARTLRYNDVSSNDLKVRSTGFKLSEIISSIGDFNRLKESLSGSSADISIDQDVYLINRCFRKYVVFNFKLSNKGNMEGQNVLFKNVFPNNMLISNRCVFINGNKINKMHVDLNDNRILIRLPNINCNENLNLTIVGCLFSRVLSFNFATISYVSRVFRNMNGINVDMSQKVSNIKIL